MHSKTVKVLIFCAGLVAVTGALAEDSFKDELQKSGSTYGPVAKRMVIYNDSQGAGNPLLPPGTGVKPVPSPPMTQSIGGPDRGLTKGSALPGGVLMATITPADRMEAGLRTLARELR